ncbi:putative schizont egress antigen-1 [Blattamonas nauphoetae]|uniref:Schizont egress antigen-1 n=1 Tax=Blattamonas nauphoetae TaxID=2049346 RepID=A0ABQ9YBT4_9EUKA|nr:putative schizont egress antigen-1 [Blattamonas nauphoetae]
MQRKQVNSCSIVPLPHSSPIVGVADPWHYAAQTGELLLDRAPSLTHPRLLALPIPGIMQRKQVNSCSILPPPSLIPDCELLLDRRTFPQPNEIVAATDHSRAVTYTDSQNSSNDFISYQHHFVCSRKAIEITEGDDEEKLQRHEKREGGDENGVGGDEKGEGGDENGEGGDENGEGGDEKGEGGDENGEGGDENGEGGDENGEGGDENGEGGDENGEGGDENGEGGDENGEGGDEKGKEEMRMGKEEMRMGKEEMRMGKEEMRMGKEEMRMGKEEMRMGKEEMRMGKEEMRMGKEEMRMGKEEMRMGMEEMRMGKEEMRMGMEEMRLGIRLAVLESKSLSDHSFAFHSKTVLTQINILINMK